MSQVLQTSGDYKIKTSRGGSIVLDTGTGIGEVRVTGDLVVEGETVYIQATNLEIEDNIILLNKGETGNGVTEGYSGIEVDRGFSAPGIENPFPSIRFDENANGWEILERIGSNVISYNNSTLKVRQITTDANTDGGDLTLIGSGTGVVKVLGTTNYELQVNSDDDIPNKRYVDVSIRNRDPDNKLQRDDTYVVVQDTAGGATARAVMQIQNISVNQPGIDYTVGELLVLIGGTASVDAVIRVEAILPGGGIADFTIINNGQFIQLPLSNSNIPTTANSLGTNATFDIEWNVNSVQVLNPGDDYESASVAFGSVPGAFPASAVAVVDLDPFSETYRQITGVNMVDAGAAYSAIPTVTLIAGSSLALTESRVQVVVDSQNIATFYSNRLEVGDLEIQDNAITNNNTNGNIQLRTFGTAGVEFSRAAIFNTTGTLDPVAAIPGSTLIFSNDSTIGYKNPAGNSTENVDVLTPGGTGLYYNHESQTIAWQQWVINNTQFSAGDLVTYPVKNELISKHKALVYSILF